MTTYRVTARLDDIAPSPTNPRKHFPDSDLAELAASIKEHGLITPILLRTNQLADNIGAAHYELISGERRWRAAKLAGLETIPADVRDDLSATAIIEIQLIENLQRADLHPMDEAEGYGQMILHHGHTAETLAEKIGKSRSYIFGRLKLLDLSEDGRRLFHAGALNPSTALLVARIPTHKLQAKAIEELTGKNNYHGDPMSVRQAQRWIRDRYMLALDKSPFPIDDPELIATAGPCSACPKRTGNNPDLFDDIDCADVCTDPDCHTAKKMAAAERRAREAGPDVTVISGDEAEKLLPSHAIESRTHVKLDSTCYDDPKHRTYREIIGDDAKAIVLVERPEKGELVPVVAKKVISEKLKEQGIVTRSAQKSDDNKKIKAQVATENAFRDALYRKVREEAKTVATSNLVYGKNFETVLSYALPIITKRFLTDAGNSRGEQTAALWGAIGHTSWDRLEAFRNGLVNFKLEEQLLICLDLALLAEHQTDEHNLKRQPEGLLAMAKALGIDIDAVRSDVKSAQKPPKKTKKQPPGASEDDLPPSEAAQAAETMRAEGDAPTEAARAGEESPLPENPAPANAVAKALSSGSDEPNEKPTEVLPEFAIGDRVQVKEKPNDAAVDYYVGMIGTVRYISESLIAKGLPVYGVCLDKGEEADFFPTEIRKITEENLIESNEKPSGAEWSFEVGNIVRVKDDAVAGGGWALSSRGKVGKIIEIDDEYGYVVVSFDGDGDGGECIHKDQLIWIGGDQQADPEIEAGQRLANKNRAAIQYRHPENAELEWTGRGRKPKWVEHCISNGLTLDDLKVEGAAA